MSYNIITLYYCQGIIIGLTLKRTKYDAIVELTGNKQNGGRSVVGRSGGLAGDF